MTSEAESQAFGDRAAELAGFASMLLGWRPAEFWSSTPTEFATALGQEQRPAEQIDRVAIEQLRSQFPDD